MSNIRLINARKDGRITEESFVKELTMLRSEEAMGVLRVYCGSTTNKPNACVKEMLDKYPALSAHIMAGAVFHGKT